MLAAGSHGGHMLASGSDGLASGSDNDIGVNDIVTQQPPDTLLQKPCKEARPYVTKQDIHQWSWTKAKQGARVEMRAGDWNQKWLAYELFRHGMVVSIKAVRGKLKNSKKSDHESDTNFYCWLTAEPASGGSRLSQPASGSSGPAAGGWAATMGYSRFKDDPGRTHGWVQFGRYCNSDDKKKYRGGVPRVFRIQAGQHR